MTGSRVVLLSYTGYTDRLNGVISDISRFGYFPDVVFDFPNIVRDMLFKDVGASYMASGGVRGVFNTTLRHYAVIKESYLLGYSDLIIMEDDIRFMKDADMVLAYTDSIPAGCDVALYEYFRLSGICTPSSVSDSMWYTPDLCFGAGCYRLSRRGMDYMVRLYEREIGNCTFRACDHFFNKNTMSGVKFYVPRVPVCIQVECPGGVNCKSNGMSLHDFRYSPAGILRQDYAEF